MSDDRQRGILRPEDLRRFQRYEVELAAHLIQDGLEIPCRVKDISAGGARVCLDPIALSGLRKTSATRIVIHDLGNYPAKIASMDRFCIGIAFNISLSVQSNLNALLTARYE